MSTEADDLKLWNALSGAAQDTLIGLCKHGPLWDGDVPSKSGRDDLIALRMAARIVMGDQWVKAQRNRSETMLQAEEGYQAATPLGRAVWKAGYVEPRKDIVRKLVPPEYVRNKP